MSKNPIDELELSETECLIDPAELEVGHFVSRLDRLWRDSPFPLEGVMILSEEQRTWFVDECKWVVIDLLRGRNAHRPPSARSIQASQTRHQRGRFNPINMLRRASLNSDTVRDAVECHDLLYRQAATLIDALRKTGQLDPEQARLGLRQIAGSLESNIAAMIWLTRIRNADERTAEHSVNVAILSMGVARARKWDDETIERAGLAGLLHDLGKVRLDPAIINKTGSLDAAEMAHIQRHCAEGYDLLLGDERIEPEVARAVLEHHECPDGTGYPDGKTADQLSPLSMLIAVVNAYDDMTAPDADRPAMSHHEALGVLWRERRRRYDAETVETLIQFLGWVTPGSLVRLSDGGHAVVVQTSQEHRLWPVVRRLRRSGGGYVAADRVDLARQVRAVGVPAIKVEEVLPDGSIDVDLNAILLREAITDDVDED